MNNLEHIRTLDVKDFSELLDINIKGCLTDMCSFYAYGECQANGSCMDGLISWLESEYVEQDSAEKFSRELAMMAEADCNVGWACLYGHSFKGFDHYDGCSTCKFDRDKDCVKQVFSDLSKRIAELDA